MFVIQLAFETKMNELKRLLSSISVVGPISLAVTIPWIMFKMLSSAWLNKGYNELAGKVVVITGASSGLGEALAHEFYKYGAQVVLCARRRQELERVRRDLLHSHCNGITHSPIIIPLDLSDFNDLQNHTNKLHSITGKIDILVNNAGISHRGKVNETSIEVDQKIMDVNYFGTVALTKSILNIMLSNRQGHIVFISSIQGLVALPERSAYSASKHALQAFGDSLRAEVASDNIFVTVVSPGYIKTELSVNALTGSGIPHGKMDATTESGLTPAYAAEQIVKGIVTKKKEVIVSTILPRIAIFLRKFLPFVYFLVMEKRAKKGILKKSLAQNISSKQK